MNAESINSPEHWALLVVPRLRVQNANAISSPLTWGFPAMTAFLGLMTALERRLGPEWGVQFKAVGVICHDFEAQVTTGGFTRAFHLTRNPVGADGSTAGIVEEGRVHLELTLVFSVRIASARLDDAERQQLLDRVVLELAGMRLAGGSVMPALPGARGRRPKPYLELEAEDELAQRQQLRKLARTCLPGFALVSRDDLLRARLAGLHAEGATGATALDAWLDLSRWNHRAVQSGEDGAVTWQTDGRVGWTVPIPVGYAALSDLFAPGAVAGARDNRTPFRFVETIWSMGQWVSPHRLRNLDDLFWYARVEGDGPHTTYRCCNDFNPSDQALETDA
ncbi:type I-F CRISPR-associated protein Csy2 [Curvibacter sp. HBC61]|uniref:Type I-F CRISPR-associated protein Csy2 n=1 Tax=Curvibacter cyanobacteriorum TaxID=3026422 RepID=A0ABT5N1L4_9BURK|nr:type I-F CRISPR-associated protein Csy2 [Curvibacter sp. HBC61]MDD0840194.1 type I-F CRISPR-associated protein Csy2 [Curvibacter sp. HBC61]